MKVLLVHDYGTATGGAELQMLALREGLRERGYDARLFSSRASLVPGEQHADYTCFGSTKRLQVLSQTANPSAYLALRRALATFKPDVVHVRMFLWQLSPLILPLLRDVPSLYQVAVHKPICPKGTKLLPDGSPCRDPAGLACLRHRCLTPQSWVPLMVQMELWQRWRHAFDQVVTLSDAVRVRLEEAGIGPVEVIHNGVPERPMRPPLSGPPTLAYGGRLSAEKGVDVLLHATARVRAHVPEARLLVAGAGPEAPRLHALAEHLGLSEHVTWLGHLPRAEMERQFDTVWVQAVPSLWEEPFGNVTTEAMMRGTAVVASRVGGQREIVRPGETGFLVPPGQVPELTRALVTLLGDRERAEQMGQTGRARALSHFSRRRCLDQFVALYERLCGAPARPRLLQTEPVATSHGTT